MVGEEEGKDARYFVGSGKVRTTSRVKTYMVRKMISAQPGINIGVMYVGYVCTCVEGIVDRRGGDVSPHMCALFTTIRLFPHPSSPTQETTMGYRPPLRLICMAQSPRSAKSHQGARAS